MLDAYTMRHLREWSLRNVRPSEYDAWIDYVLGELVADPTLVDLGWATHHVAFVTKVDA